MSERVFGATHLGEGRCRFVVWAPEAKSVEVRIAGSSPRSEPLDRTEGGFHEAVVARVPPGTRYRIALDGKERPDPASRFQPEGVHGPSEVVDPDFPWTDSGWKGVGQEQYLLYELHVGTFTEEGTFDAAIAHLDALKELGVTAVELMPVAEFPGARNWGYDGAAPFAVQSTYGGPAGLKRFVDACHARGLGAVLDVVYNHLGPEGNYLWGTAPYFTDRYRTPWGPAVNFDGAGSDPVRSYFIQNALMWIEEFHFDGLRLDAVHAILDHSARPFLEELAAQAHAASVRMGRPVTVIAESNQNDPRLVRAADRGGYGLDAVWNDDFHHVLRVLLTGDASGYYEDFGTVEELGRAIAEGFVYTGQYSRYRGPRHGRSSKDVFAHRFVVYAQNHDQVGNRMKGERLTSLVSFEALKLAAGAVLTAPALPLLFMGEEYGETAPFPFFVSHGDEALIESVRRGRREEFARFKWEGEPPDPQAEETFRTARLDRSVAERPQNRLLLDYYKTLIALRKRLSPLARLTREGLTVSAYEDHRVLLVHRMDGPSRVIMLFNLSGREARLTLPPRGGTWGRVLDSSDARWGGPGATSPETIAWDAPAEVALAPWSVALYHFPPDVARELSRSATRSLGKG